MPNSSQRRVTRVPVIAAARIKCTNRQETHKNLSKHRTSNNNSDNNDRHVQVVLIVIGTGSGYCSTGTRSLPVGKRRGSMGALAGKLELERCELEYSMKVHIVTVAIMKSTSSYGLGDIMASFV